MRYIKTHQEVYNELCSLLRDHLEHLDKIEAAGQPMSLEDFHDLKYLAFSLHYQKHMLNNKYKYKVPECLATIRQILPGWQPYRCM
ncbi:uncharacterized protein EHS24_007404 [Apiotrichum porosum]|uniref:Uncharacterized protein n=1 Tax=Apiotrichum porosum TaxID=105984 RepID=A0A427XUM3_9TREE|nr:uncharacterized protein EHS24_007404 [Apiotrichum porosum]RSH82435.1 hypothetical protein EHS24_007404 [Apiotrichum porosum]